VTAPAWVGLWVVAPCWAVLSAHLLLQGWLATANFFIAIVALVRGRMSPSRALGAVLSAAITGLACSMVLRGGFWLLVEVMGFGATWLEQVAYLWLLAAAAAFMLNRLPSQIQSAWRFAMNPESASDRGT
jgi:hypothetical protein